MSILLVEVLPQGIIFGADRNVTDTETRIDVEKEESIDEGGNTQTLINNYTWTEIYHIQSQRPKVLRWPKRKALIGYVGVAAISGIPTDEWLFEFMGDHFSFSNLEELSESLRASVEKRRQIDEGNNPPKGLIIHLGGFELREGIQVPIIRFIRNVDSDGKNPRKEFENTEEFWGEFTKRYPDANPRNIKAKIDLLASEYNPWWFHQGFDLGTFNHLELFLKAAFRDLCKHHPDHTLPKTLFEWERQIRMSILTYGAYFQAFKGPSEQFVGGGADIVSLEWPEQPV
jgi:hypothetical protein